MPRNSSGTYSKPAGSTAVAGEVIGSQAHNDLFDDIGDAITGSLPRDGSGAMLGALDMGGNKITGLLAPDAATDLATYADVVAMGDGSVTVGTIMLFAQTTPPSGWTKVTTHNNKALRVVNGTASSGGSTGFTSVFTSRTISSANMPAHTHDAGTLALASDLIDGDGNIVTDIDQNKDPASGSGGAQCVQDVDWSFLDDGSLSFSTTITGTSSSAGSGTALDFAVHYHDVILASKDA